MFRRCSRQCLRRRRRILYAWYTKGGAETNKKKCCLDTGKHTHTRHLPLESVSWHPPMWWAYLFDVLIRFNWIYTYIRNPNSVRANSSSTAWEYTLAHYIMLWFSIFQWHVLETLPRPRTKPQMPSRFRFVKKQERGAWRKHHEWMLGIDPLGNPRRKRKFTARRVPKW